MLRSEDKERWIVTASLFTLSATVGGCVAGLFLGFLGAHLPVEIRLSLAALVSVPAVIFGGIEVIGGRVRVLQCSRETPQRWVFEGPVSWATKNGIALGVGAGNRLGFWLWYAVPFGALIAGEPVMSAAFYGVYSFARGVAPWVIIFAARRVGFPRASEWLIGHYQVARRIAASHLVVLGTATALRMGL